MGLFSTAAPAEPRRHKSPAIALLLSLLLPGAGHLYCGKKSTGVWTMAFFLIAAAVAIYGQPDSAREMGLIYAIPIYIFAFLDALFTTREANQGADHLPNGNPRIAATLNLLTSGLGYFYLGERTLGLVILLGGRFVGNLLPRYVAIVLQIGLAVHAYIKCRRMYPPEPPRIPALTG